MNTLPRAITAQVLTDPATYNNLRLHWRKLMSSPRKHDLGAAHHLLYAILLGRDWRKGFTCITNRRKLDNGAFQGWMLFRAVAALHKPSAEAELLAPFDGLVTLTMLQHIRQIVPFQNVYHFQPDQFAARRFPFEAYSLVAPVLGRDDR
ncbi:MAG TPA: hypothetical protein VKQ72_11010 [Aggregatilineales bacterium]|nr:hypothetical protein [Aggregatilineales bacterium]